MSVAVAVAHTTQAPAAMATTQVLDHMPVLKVVTELIDRTNIAVESVAVLAVGT